MLGRFARDLPPFVRTPIRYDQAVDTVRDNVARRSARLLELVERSVEGNARSPYRRLLLAAGCEPGDIRAMVAADGPEGTLARLARAGVYVTFDELKGRAEAVRGSQRFHFAESDFDNPNPVPHFSLRTGGTGGSPRRIERSLRMVDGIVFDKIVAHAAHGITRPEHVFWMTAPIVNMLSFARMGEPTAAWFYPLEELPSATRIGARYVAAIGRLGGYRFPIPRTASLQNTGHIVDWLAPRMRAGRTVCLSATASAAVRVAVAAAERGLVLDGVYFLTSGEPVTAARRRELDASGARTIVNYGMVEAGLMAISCGAPDGPDDLHVLSSRFALIRRPRPVANSATTVAAFLLTTLDPDAPKVLINAETGDYGDLRRRECGCLLGRVGLREHIARVRSFEKLTGEGATFATADLIRILEEVLPAHFGGTSGDYQLLEEEGGAGLPSTSLLVSPGVGPLAEADIRTTFLEALAALGEVERQMAKAWGESGTLRIKRQPPAVTPAGKVFPFRLLRADQLARSGRDRAAPR